MLNFCLKLFVLTAIVSSLFVCMFILFTVLFLFLFFQNYFSLLGTAMESVAIDIYFCFVFWCKYVCFFLQLYVCVSVGRDDRKLYCKSIYSDYLLLWIT